MRKKMLNALNLAGCVSPLLLNLTVLVAEMADGCSHDGCPQGQACLPSAGNFSTRGSRAARAQSTDWINSSGGRHAVEEGLEIKLVP